MPPTDPREKDYRNFLDNQLAIFTANFRNCACPRGELTNFKFLKVFGQGGFGRVYSASHKDWAEEVAVKIQSKSRIVAKDRVEMVIREKEIQWALHSDFCVQLLAAFKDASNIYMVMELGCYGGLDKQIYSLNGLPDRTWRLIAGMIVLGLEYLHSCNLLYRDLKPENVFVFSDGYVKLGDFGLTLPVKTLVLDLIGSIPYMAPEMFRQGSNLDGVDWWAFGVLLYELYSRDWVFGADPDAFNAKRLIQEAIPILAHADVPDDACDLVVKLVNKDVTKRLGCMQNGADDIKRHEFFEGISFMDLFEKKIVIDLVDFDRFEHKIVKDGYYPKISDVDRYEKEFREF